MRRDFREVAFTLCLLPLLAGAGLWIALGLVDVARPAAWLAIALVTLGWGGALGLAPGVRDSFALGVVLAAPALGLRLAFLASELALSDDAYRHVWEGALVARGVDPYASAPSAPELAGFQQRWREVFERVNHPEVPAAYPPLAQALHAGVVAAAGGAERPARALFLLRILYGGCDLLVLLPLAALLRRRRRPLAWLAAWAWNPWVAQEFAGAGHLDALAILCTLGALATASVRQRLEPRRAGAALALLAAGTALKLLPLALVPFVLRRARHRLAAAASFAGALALGCLPLLFALRGVPRLDGLGEYAFRWESFNLVHRWLEPPLARHFDFDERWSDPRRLARGLLLGLWLAFAVRAWRQRLDPARAAALLFGGFVVLTPTLHPWYLAWVVPFLALRPSLAWGALLALAPLLYWPLARWRAEQVWEEPAWLYPLVAGTFFGLLLLERLRRRRT